MLQDPISICVFAVPIEDVENRNRGDTKEHHPLNQWFTKFSEADELLRLAAAREQVDTFSIYRTSCIILSYKFSRIPFDIALLDLLDLKWKDLSICSDIKEWKNHQIVYSQ